MKKYHSELNSKISQYLTEGNTLDGLLEFIIKEFSYSKDILLSKTRKREVVFVRQVFCFLAVKSLKEKRYGGISLATIGQYINRDHATVLHSVNTIQDLCDTNKTILNLVLDTQTRFETQVRKRQFTMEAFAKKTTDKFIDYPKVQNKHSILLRAVLNSYFNLAPNDPVIFKTGVEIKVPVGYEGHITTYGGEDKFVVYQSPMIIDEFYNDEVYITLINLNSFNVAVKTGDVIGMLRFYKAESPDLIMIKSD